MNQPSVDIRALAKLARLEISDEEIARLERELPGILDLVETIQNAPTAKDGKAPRLRNVMREDAAPYQGGAFTEALLNAAPNRIGDRIEVKQVITRKKN